MSTFTDYQQKTWKRRWQALQQAMQATDAALPTGTTPREQTLRCLLKTLQTFGEAQFKYFFNSKSPPRRYSREYALGVTLGQVADDLEAIERAAHQRISATPRVRDTLDRADRLAIWALQPAIGRLLKEKPAVLTYFQKSPAIRVIPYAQVALIGIPFTCISNAQDFFAVPHEIGHFVFWQGTESEGAGIESQMSSIMPIRLSGIQRQFELPKGVLRWTEEIFADVYGSLIAGPTIALDFQDLQLNRSQDEFVEDDGEHPVPALRPDVYARAIERISERDQTLKEWPQRLRDRWKVRLSERGYPDRFKPYPPPTFRDGLCSVVSGISAWWGCHQSKLRLDDERKLNDAREKAHKVVDVAYDRLKDIDLAEDWWQSVRSEVKLYDVGDLEKVYDDFERKVNEIVLPGPEPDFLKLEPCQVDPKALQYRFIDEDRKIRPLLPEREIRAFTENEWDWIAVLRAGGWATKGPKQNWP